MLFGVTSTYYKLHGAANEIPRGISVPAFCVHTYFAPSGVYISGVSFAVERLRSHPARDGARGSAPFVSIHTVLELTWSSGLSTHKGVHIRLTPRGKYIV